MNASLAYSLNRKLIKESKTPHERDLARMRIHIIHEAKKRREAKENGNHQS